MNVGNLMAAPVTPGITSVPSQEFAGVGNLFALQISSALQNLQQTDSPPLATSNLSEADSEQMADWLAMLQQLLEAGLPQQRELIPQIEKSAAAWEQGGMPLPAGSVPRLSAEETQRLITAFTQHGMSQELAAKTVDLLVQLSQAEVGQTQPKWQEAAKQAQDVLTSLGLQKPERKLQDTAVERKSWWSPHAAVIAGTVQNAEDKYPSALPHPNQTIQTLRVNAALSRYQAESGIATRNSLVSSEWNSVTSSRAELQATREEMFLNVQSPTAPLTTPPSSGTFMSTVVSAGQVVQGDRFAQEVSQLFVKQMKIGTMNGVSEAKLILYPQSLGQVDVKILAQDGVITAQFTAETASGKELLDNQLPQLRAALTQQGLQVDRLEVTQQQEQSMSFQQQREQSRQQQDERRERNRKEEHSEFSLEQLVDRTEPLSSLWTRLRNAAGVEYSA